MRPLRSNQTPEERDERRAENSARMNEARANETPKQSTSRVSRITAHMRQVRLNESEENRRERLNRDALNRARRTLRTRNTAVTAQINESEVEEHNLGPMNKT